MSQPILSFKDVSKSFYGTAVLKHVTFDVWKGECVALVGENGAGKSTLMKILCGVWPSGSFEGEVTFEGRPIKFENTLEARKAGISVIHQELCLFPELTVAENLFLTEAFPYDGTPSLKAFSRVRWDDMFEKAQSLLGGLGFKVDPRARIGNLSVAKRQLVEIARAVHHDARLLILDEPTSALSAKEVAQLFQVVEQMRKREVTFLFISHRFEEIFAICDRIVVLRDGQSVASMLPAQTDEKEVVKQMVGRPITYRTRKQRKPGKELLRVEKLGHVLPNGKKILENVDIAVREGEVVGVGGLMGAGRSELMRSILGVLPGTRMGQVYREGVAIQVNGIDQALQHKLAFVPEDRKKDGLFLGHPIGFNMTVPILKRFSSWTGWMNSDEEDKKVAELINRMRVKCRSAADPVRNLSGGNQQKVLLSKWVAAGPKVLFLDEPTRGIDVAAKEEIYEVIEKLADEGLGILLVTSELPELLNLSDRIVVLREGRLVGEMQNQGLTQESVMSLATGAGHGIH